jgi:hypothetical protein
LVQEIDMELVQQESIIKSTSPQHSVESIQVGEQTVPKQQHVAHPFEASDQQEEFLRSTKVRQVEINQNDKEAELENDTPSIQAENVEKPQTEKPLLEIDPKDTKQINAEEINL